MKSIRLAAVLLLTVGVSAGLGACDGTSTLVSDDAAPGDSPSADASGDAVAMVDGAAEDAGTDGASLDSTVADSTATDSTVEASSDAASDGAADAADGAAPIDAGVDAALDCTALGPNGEPRDLGCTGLYSSWATRTIATDLLPYDPALHFWSDGAAKSRWIRLPAGQKIDTSTMDEWAFPAGTRFWKEFRLGGLKVETRMTWKQNARNDSWVRVSYAWSQDQTTATELPAGRTNVWGTTYEIPSQGDCTLCHQGRIDGVLGFEGIGLSSPNATGETMARLITDALITNPPAAALVIPGNATESAALGWLHANCGTSCHSGLNSALAVSTGFRMRLNAGQLASVMATDTYTTGVGVVSGYQPTPDAGLLRIKPHDTAHSCVHFRDSSRVAGEAMPPFATHLVDTAGVQLVDNWINALP
jgi:hypothetical protein